MNIVRTALLEYIRARLNKGSYAAENADNYVVSDYVEDIYKLTSNAYRAEKTLEVMEGCRLARKALLEIVVKRR